MILSQRQFCISPTIKEPSPTVLQNRSVSPLPIGLIPEMTTEELGEVVSKPELHPTVFAFVMEELDNRKYDEEGGR